jgi:hypothetical protein
MIGHDRSSLPTRSPDVSVLTPHVQGA